MGKQLHSCFIVMAALAALVAGCVAPTATRQPAMPASGWPTSTPEQQGMDSGKLAEMLEAVESQHISLHSVLIMRHGYLVAQVYYHPYGPDVRHSIESNTKSIIGTLVGIAIDQGAIKSVDQPVLDFFPDRIVSNVDDQKKSMTLAHLLSMTPGLDCEDRTPGAEGMYQTRVWAQYLLDLPMTSRPGRQWIYCSGASHLLSAVLRQATGMDARTYANRYLFKPLGLAEVEEKDWRPDPQGVTNGVAGLYLTPRELARYGYLYLNRGTWAGQTIVSSRWVQDSTREQAYIGPDAYVGGLDRRFGYLWSIFPERKYYGYLGMGGQELYVLPEQDMVVVFTAALPVGKEAVLLKLLDDYIVPAARSSPALAPNPQASARLSALISAAAGTRQPVAPLPPIAGEITGKTYVMDQNSLGWTDMTWYFAGTDEAILKMTGTPDLVLGLDNRYRLTEIPNGRPIGLRGRWEGPDTFYLEDINLGDIVESQGWVKFEGDSMTLSIKSTNWVGQPLTLRGSRKKP